jgi:hypothetical protein
VPPSGKVSVLCVFGILSLCMGLDSGFVWFGSNRVGEVEIISLRRFNWGFQFPVAFFPFPASAFSKWRWRMFRTRFSLLVGLILYWAFLLFMFYLVYFYVGLSTFVFVGISLCLLDNFLLGSV